MRSLTEFVWASATSAKAKCSACGATGWGSVGYVELSDLPRAHWQRKHGGAHLWPCECGRTFVSRQALGSHVTPRRHPRDAAYRALHQALPQSGDA